MDDDADGFAAPIVAQMGSSSHGATNAEGNPTFNAGTSLALKGASA